MIRMESKKSASLRICWSNCTAVSGGRRILYLMSLSLRITLGECWPLTVYGHLRRRRGRETNELARSTKRRTYCDSATGAAVPLNNLLLAKMAVGLATDSRVFVRSSLPFPLSVAGNLREENGTR